MAGQHGGWDILECYQWKFDLGFLQRSGMSAVRGGREHSVCVLGLNVWCVLCATGGVHVGVRGADGGGE